MDTRYSHEREGGGAGRGEKREFSPARASLEFERRLRAFHCEICAARLGNPAPRSAELTDLRKRGKEREGGREMPPVEERGKLMMAAHPARRVRDRESVSE